MANGLDDQPCGCIVSHGISMWTTDRIISYSYKETLLRRKEIRKSIKQLTVIFSSPSKRVKLFNYESAT